MPYPKKTDSQSVTDAALAIVEREGEEALTLRRVAADVGVTANAIYRYFDSRDVLVAATANAAARRLYIAIEKGMSELPGDETIENRVRKLLALQSDFAQKNPALWRTILSANPEAGAKLPEPRYHKMLWDRALSIIGPLVRPEDGEAATLSLWAQLHGLWSLRQAGILGRENPKQIDEFAFEAIIRGLKR